MTTGTAGPAVGSMVTDPVCGMTIAREHAVATAEHEGRTYHFCAEGVCPPLP